MWKRTVPEARDLIFCLSRYSIHISGTGRERRHIIICPSPPTRRQPVCLLQPSERAGDKKPRESQLTY